MVGGHVSSMRLDPASLPLLNLTVGDTFEVTLVDPVTSTIVLQQSLTSSGDATSGHFRLSGITPGIYDRYVKGSNTLSAMQSVTLDAGSNAVTFTALRSGDANGDNVVSLADFSILALSFNKTSGTPGYDSRADSTAMPSSVWPISASWPSISTR